MNLPSHGPIYDLKNGRELPKLFPLNSEELTALWWAKFIDLGGWDCFDSEKENMDFNSDLSETTQRD